MPTHTHTPKKSPRAARPCARAGCGNPVTGSAAPFCSVACQTATKGKETLEIKYTIEIHPDDTPVRGNALASGDDALDKAAEDEILARLDAGDFWAWCVVEVTAHATINGITTDFLGVAHLGACSYEDEAQFKTAGGYYEDLCAEAREDLIKNLNKAIARGRSAETVERMMLDQLLATLKG